MATKSGSVESLNGFIRCGAKPNARHTGRTVDINGPLAAAMPRELQRVASGGTLCQGRRDHGLDARVIHRAGRPGPQFRLFRLCQRQHHRTSPRQRPLRLDQGQAYQARHIVTTTNFWFRIIARVRLERLK